MTPKAIDEQLRAFLCRPRLTPFMQVHDGISTRVAEQRGFEALWASSFGCSTALGLPDDDSLPMRDVLGYLSPILRSSTVPVLVDGNCGFGHRAETETFLRALVDMGVAGVCFEDKRFPKANTFYQPRHPLREMEEYGELIAMASTMFPITVVARTEGLVVGESLEQVRSRCMHYCAVGAEAIFLSWIERDITQLLRFIEIWNGYKPLLLNPTSYGASLSQLIGLPGVAAVVWANHNIRASVRAMQCICDALLDVKSVTADTMPRLDDNMSSMADIFALIGYGR